MVCIWRIAVDDRNFDDNVAELSAVFEQRVVEMFLSHRSQASNSCQCLNIGQSIYINIGIKPGLKFLSKTRVDTHAGRRRSRQGSSTLQFYGRDRHHFLKV